MFDNGAFLNDLPLVLSSTMTLLTTQHVWLAAKQLLQEHGGRDFNSIFGKTPEVVALTWNLLDLGDTGAKLKHLLWALMFMKTYSKEPVLASMAKVTRKTFRKWVWIVIFRIADLSGNIVSELTCFAFCIPLSTIDNRSALLCQ